MNEAAPMSAQIAKSERARLHIQFNAGTSMTQGSAASLHPSSVSSALASLRGNDRESEGM